MPRKKPRDDRTAKATRPSDPDLRIIHALRQLARSLEIHSRRLAAEKDVTSAQLFCMKMVAKDGVDTATKVARKVHLSPSTVVGILDRLEEKKYIERRRDTEDRRVVRVSLTKTGRKLVRDTPHPIEDLLSRQRDSLDRPEANRLANALERLVSVLGAEEIDATTPYGELPPSHLLRK